jgi:hypothetical protein
MATLRTVPAEDATFIPLAPGIAAPSPITLYVDSWEDVYDLEITVVAVAASEDKLGRFECSGVAVRQRPDGPAVTGELLRKIPIARYIRGVGTEWWQTYSRHGQEISFADERLTDEKVELLRLRGPVDETLQWVARAYQMAVILGDAPLRAVEKSLDVPRSTAGRWVALARERGYLPSEGLQAGGAGTAKLDGGA